MVTACSYISLNFNFVNSNLSIHILKALVPIVAKLLEKEDPRTASPSKREAQKLNAN